MQVLPGEAPDRRLPPSIAVAVTVTATWQYLIGVDQNLPSKDLCRRGNLEIGPVAPWICLLG